MKRIPIGDYQFTDEDRDAIDRVMSSGRISEHKEVRAFEDEFASYIGVNYCVAVSSGTAALISGLTAMKAVGMLADHDRVLIPALTFVATANAVSLSGLDPVFGDILSHSFCMDPREILNHSDVELVLPVHLLGYTANMGNILRYAKEINAYVAEDAAEAHGSKLFGFMAGSMSSWSAFSFYIAHTVQAGELGAFCTNDHTLANAVRSIKAHGRMCTCKECVRSQGKCPKEGQNPRFTSQYIGYNFKPMEFQAALARVQLQYIEENIASRKANEHRISYGLRDLVRNGTINPHPESNAELFRNVPMVYPVVLTTEGIRDSVIREIESRGVECRPLFNCIPTQMPSYANHPQALDKFTVSEYYGSNGFYIPCHQYLTTEDISTMTEIVSDVVERSSK